jgi:peptide deformylase
MALLQILHFPDSRLRTKAKAVETVDDNIRQIVANMFETMYSADGIGLAATQVNIHQQIIVMDISETRNQPLCLINPEIVKQEGRKKYQEGCLSVPGIYEDVERPAVIDVKYLDRDGHEQITHAVALLAVCIQHEIDHLRGKLFVDYLSPFKRDRARKKIAKLQRQTF